MTYTIKIVEIAVLRFNNKESAHANIISCMVEKQGKEKHLMEGCLCFSDEQMRLFLKKYRDMADISEYLCESWTENKKLLEQFSRAKLLVEEESVVDYDDEWSDVPEYDTKNNLFDPQYYNPDDWEFWWEVKQVL